GRDDGGRAAGLDLDRHVLEPAVPAQERRRERRELRDVQRLRRLATLGTELLEEPHQRRQPLDFGLEEVAGLVVERLAQPRQLDQPADRPDPTVQLVTDPGQDRVARLGPRVPRLVGAVHRAHRRAAARPSPHDALSVRALTHGAPFAPPSRRPGRAARTAIGGAARPPRMPRTTIRTGPLARAPARTPVHVRSGRYLAAGACTT